MLVNVSRLVDLFKELCLIDAPARAERECVDYVKALLTEMGLEVREDEAGEAIGGNAGNVIARLKGNLEGAPKIFLSAHFDTVEPTAGLVILDEDGIIKTDGTTILGADDKGGMAPAIEAIRILQETGAKHGDVYLIFCVAEEIGLLGADEVDFSEIDVDFGYVLDTGPPVGSFVTRTATHDKLDVVIRGKPAHAGKDPECGISAIEVMSRAISKMKLGRIDPETTANFGLVQGGTAVNVVCPYVQLRGEARSTNEETLDAQIDHMIECLTEATNHFGAKLEIDHRRHYRSYEIDDNEQVVQVAKRASEALGFVPELRTTLGGSDANKFNAKGVKSIVVATGMQKIHTHEEFIAVKDLIDTAELAYQLIIQAAVQS